MTIEYGVDLNNDIPTTTIQFISSYLTYYDQISFSKVSKSSYYGCYGPLQICRFDRILFLNLFDYSLQTKSNDKMAVFNYISNDLELFIDHTDNSYIKLFNNILPSLTSLISKKPSFKKLTIYTSINPLLNKLLKNISNINDLALFIIADNYDNHHIDITLNTLAIKASNNTLDRLCLIAGDDINIDAARPLFIKLFNHQIVENAQHLSTNFDVATLGHIAKILETSKMRKNSIAIYMSILDWDGIGSTDGHSKSLVDYIWTIQPSYKYKKTLMRLNEVYDRVIIIGWNDTDQIGMALGQRCRFKKGGKCSKSFDSRKELVEHIKIHKVTEPSRICLKCGKLSSNKGNHEKHMNSKKHPI